MSKKKDTDANAKTALAGLALFVVGVAGFGWWRSRVEQARGVCKPIEESVYRGFKYRIEQCPFGDTIGYLAILPAQQVGTIEITEDAGNVLETLDDARKFLQMVIDEKVGPQLTAVFVGANR